MALDYLTSVYKHEKNQFPRDRPTSYSVMSRWMDATFPDINDSQARGTSASEARIAAIDSTIPIHLRYSNDCGYDDFHKAFRAINKQWPTVSYPTFGPPRLRHGKQGSSWRHVAEVLQAGGKRLMYVDGQTSLNDRYKMEHVPGAELLHGREGPVPSVPEDEETQEQELIAKYRRIKQRRTPKKMLYDRVQIYQGVERNNWLIMR